MTLKQYRLMHWIDPRASIANLVGPFSSIWWIQWGRSMCVVCCIRISRMVSSLWYCVLILVVCCWLMLISFMLLMMYYYWVIQLCWLCYWVVGLSLIMLMMACNDGSQYQWNVVWFLFEYSYSNILYTLWRSIKLWGSINKWLVKLVWKYGVKQLTIFQFKLLYFF